MACDSQYEDKTMDVLLVTGFAIVFATASWFAEKRR
jgi:hypothetical protein